VGKGIMTLGSEFEMAVWIKQFRHTHTAHFLSQALKCRDIKQYAAPAPQLPF